MNSIPLIGLMNNIAMLLAMALIFDLSLLHVQARNELLRQVLFGIIIGFIGIAVMLSSWPFAPGIIFDTRSVLLGISGIFFGLIPAGIAMFITAVFRFSQGGGGAITGILVIIATGSMGIAWGFWRRKRLNNISWMELYLFGILSHIVMLALMFTLPFETAVKIVSSAGLPIMLMYPVCTVLIGLLMNHIMLREKASRNIVDSELKLRIVADNTYDWEFWINPQGRFLYSSPSCLRITGYSANEFQNDNELLYKIIHPEDKDIFNQHKHFVNEKHEVGRIEFRIIRKDSFVCWIEHICQPVYDDSGIYLGTRGSNRDVTDRKKMEENVKEKQFFLEHVLNATPDLVYIYDLNKKCNIFANHELTEILGYTPQQVQAMGSSLFANILHPDDWESVAAHHAGFAMAKDGEIHEVTYRMLHADGRWRWLLSRDILFLRNENGEAIQILGVCEDITEKKMAYDQHELTVKVFECLNSDSSKEDIVYNTLLSIKKFTGIEAVAIRLKEKDDYPYFVTDGFPPHFVEAERFLCSIDESGDPLRDSNGCAYLECMCGNILCGRTDIQKPFFTKGGSFWSNCTTKLLASTTDEDRQTVTRNRCNSQGYESVALIPLGSGVGITGLLQLNDHRKDMFTLDLIEFLEGLSLSVAIAIAKKSAQETIFEKTEELDRFFSLAIDLLCIADFKGNFIRLNKAWENILGYRLENLEGHKFLDFVHPDDISATLNAMETLLSGRTVINFVNRYRCKDGSYRWIEWRTAPYQSKYIYAAARDITDKIENEEALRQSMERFYSLFSNMTEGVALHEVISDNAGNPVNYRIVDINAQFEKTIGLKADSVVGRLATEVYASKEPPYGEIYFKVAKDKKPVRFETHFPPMNKYFSISVAPWGIEGFATIFEDITERKLAEEKLHNLNAELEARVKERTISLEATNRELESFAYSVSHDLRAPLRALDGFSQIIYEDYAKNLDDEGQRFLFRIRQASQKMGTLINDLLQLSRITREELNKAPVDISAIAQSVFSEIKSSDPSRQVEFILDPEMSVVADERFIRVIYDNLLRNAWKFTGKHEKAKIEAGVTVIAGAKIFFVRDNGAGFNMKYADKLFGPFQRLHGVNEFEGTGIGLATVQRIIHRHGGKIWAEGEIEQGAVFYFTFSE